VVGGEWANNGGSYGLAVAAFPAKRIPEVVDRVTQLWMDRREPDEPLQVFIKRLGRAKLKKALDDLRSVPAYEEDPSFYIDWGDAREYTIIDKGTGECAGEVVSFVQFGIADSERRVFEAQLSLESGDHTRAADLAYNAMLVAAKALVQVENIDVTDDPDSIVDEFRTRLHDTKVFHDPYAGAKFANFLFRHYDERSNGGNGSTGTASSGQRVDHESAHRTIEEAQLFIEAAHACYDRITIG
ncbi:MAG: nitrite/sulfite reductase, partial [Proteobacteria bacterium]|nr:nitrite/sulfite reductase [Pseudomonadota bacterium]